MTKHILMEDGRERNPCVQLSSPPPRAVDRTHQCTTVHRRLRKMSEKFQPSSFSLMVQARLLCVGTSVVYRVSLALTTTSTCRVGTTTTTTTASGLTTRNGGYTTHSSWVVALSQTKLCGFYAHVQAIVHHPTVTQSLVARQKQLQVQLTCPTNVVEWNPFATFLQVVTTICQRYGHLQVGAFSIQATASAMQAGTIELEAFLLDCWRALEAVIPVLVVHTFLPVPLAREALDTYLLIRDLFSLPENVLEANCTYANAILSLEDVDRVRATTPSEDSCSICLERLVSSDHKQVLMGCTAGHCHDCNSSSSSSNSINGSDNSSDDRVAKVSSVVPHPTSFAVKLPCGHVYHENCAMSWLRHNPSCPECRAVVGANS
ncbi:unnamed protein product [Hyaloperonospora brassicae]|uniref:RING-type domain-containing protein n=1 Tax=Hyaloperonospora brassicae TaxID=162125 RepID=A0AAV0SYG5_HYABA|nr:unnamed protein product [Hyaloperonospora brassicae]